MATSIAASATAAPTSYVGMRVIKRNGTEEELYFDKILNRIRTLGQEVNINLNYQSLVMKIIDQLHDCIHTSKIDELVAEQCAVMTAQHPDYAALAGRILVSNHQKNTHPSFAASMDLLHKHTTLHGELYPLVSDEFNAFVQRHAAELDSMVVPQRDYLIDYFGFKTLERAYMFKRNGRLVETPQYMWLRVAVGIHATSSSTCNEAQALDNIRETYNLMSTKHFTHATPTLFNAGTPRPQMSSCYLLAMEDDSMDGIYHTLYDCANISKYAGGIGLHIHNIRAKGSAIHGTNGTSNGIVPMLKVFNMTARYVDQGGGKRNGSIAVYMEPWHADVEDFLEMKKTHGDEEMRARDLFYALWIPDLFMERVKADAPWSLFCPYECPGLADAYGADFVERYTAYETAEKARKTVSARALWRRILDAQMETGTPYLLYKDAANAKSNQRNLGVIKSSNLCCEIMEYSDAQETAVCNLASIALPTFVNSAIRAIDFGGLYYVTQVVTRNLNRIIDTNFYPTEKTRRSNLRHRPIGVGVQGLADVFVLLDLPFHSDDALDLNRQIFETIYYAALSESNRLAQEQGAYETFQGSPASEGVLQFDLWGAKPATDRYDWDALRDNIRRYGLRNSLLVAPMPTASTSQILGFNECFEPFTSNIYSRRTLAGEFMVVNKYLVRELIDLGLWNETLKNDIIAHHGSVQHLSSLLSDHMRNKYKTVWEIPMKHLIDMAADRGPFICQSQSMNLWVEDPNYTTLTNMHFYAWKKGLKTGIYYLRRKARHHAQQFTIEPIFHKGAAADAENDTDDDDVDADANADAEEAEDEPCLTCSA